VATFGNLAIDTAGTFTLAAADTADAIAATGPADTVTVVPASPAKLVFAAEPASAIVGQSLSPAVVIDIEDTFGNLVATDTTFVALGIATGPGALDGSTTSAAVGGVATFASVRFTTSGQHTLATSDTSDSLSGFTSPAIAVAPGAPATLAFTTQPTGGSVGAAVPALAVTIKDLYGNRVTTDQSNVKLSVASGPGTLSGTVAAAVNGVATFTNLVFSIAGTYTLAAADHADSLSGFSSASFNIQSPSAQLTGGNLLVTGTSGDDVILLAVSGNDMVVTMNGQQSGGFAMSQITSIDVEAGAGNDSITIGSSLPSSLGASVQGGPGDDTITGGPGNDTLGGGQGNDSISGGPGDDSIKGGAGDDTLAGGKGNDTLFGGLGNDLLRGGLGDDSLNGGAGANQMYGGQGNNTFYAVNGAADQIFAGSAANDFLIYSAADNPIIESGTIPARNQTLVS
jgi:Ca2+-binding RTX toxin-like protein